MSLAKLHEDALLVYKGGIEPGYEPGTRLPRWLENERESGGQACGPRVRS